MAQKKVNWLRAYAIVGSIDAGQIGIDFLPPIGEIINFILDIFIGLGITFWAWKKGILDMVGALVIGITFIIELFTAGGAPFWFVDIWALQKRSGGGLIPGFDNEAAVIASAGLNRGGRREPTGRTAPLNQGGTRRPM